MSSPASTIDWTFYGEIAGIVGTIVLALILLVEAAAYRSDQKRSSIEQRREHGRFLNQCFKKLAYASLSSSDGYTLSICATEEEEVFAGGTTLKLKPADSIAYIKPAQAHLESGYKEIHYAWNALNDLIKHYNETLRLSLEHLERITRLQMKKSFPQLSEYDETKSNDYYNMQNLMRLFHDVLIAKVVADKPLEFNPTRSMESYNYRVMMGAGPLLMLCKRESDADTTTLKAVFEAVKVSQEVSQSFKELRELHSRVSISLEQFVTKLKVLVETLDLGEPIEGKCEVGY
jgi:hypothetical protein